MDARFRLGRWIVEPAAFRLHGPEGVVGLEPKVMAVLCYLAEHAGEVVSREALLKAVWPDAVVVEEALTRCVSELRKALGDDPRRPAVVETIRKGGYRLILPVTPLPEDGPGPDDVEPVGAVRPSGRRAGRRPALWMRAVIAAGVVVVATAGLVWLQRSEPRAAEPLRAVPVTSTAGMEFDARLSPDGAHVVFAWAGPDGDNVDLYVKMLGEDRSVRLTESLAVEHSAAWSPDGHRIAFMRRDAEGCRLHVVPSVGGAERRVGDCDANYFGDLAWSPDGQWLAFSEENAPGEGPHRIVLLSPETKEKRTLTQPEGTPYGDFAPAFSPDGTQIAFVRMLREEHHDLFLVPVDGDDTVERLTFDERVLRGHAWEPNGAALVVASARAGPVGLWRVPVVPGDSAVAPTWLSVGVGRALAPSIARQSGRLLFMEDQSDTNLWSLDLAAPDAPQPFASSTRHDRAPHFAPDGEHVAFVSERSGSPEVWTARRDGSEPQQRTRFGGPFVDAPRWSPDGTRIAFDARPEGHIDVHVLEVEGGTVRRLTDDPTDEALPRWSQDGETLYFASDREGTRNVWRMSAGGGPAQRVTTQGGTVLAEVADRSGFYLARNDSAGLWRVELEQPPVRLTDELHETDWGNWIVTGQSLFFVRREARRATLARLDQGADSARVVAVLSDPPGSAWSVPWSQPGITLSPDGTHLVFARIDRQESDLWMVESAEGELPSAHYVTRQRP